MKILLRAIVSVLALAPSLLLAEGSRQLTPNRAVNPATNLPYPLTDPRNDRAGFLTHDVNAATGGLNLSLGFLKPLAWGTSDVPFLEDYRLHIRLKAGETLNYGVHRVARIGGGTHANLLLTLRYGAGAGTIVSQNKLLRDPATPSQAGLLTNQAGVIANTAQHEIGPSVTAGDGGYEPLTYTNTTGATHDFYVEFTQEGEFTNKGTQPGFNDLGARNPNFMSAVRSEYDFWDFTVRDAAGQEKPGRLFSKLWSFTTTTSGGTGYENRLSANFALFPLIESPQHRGQYYVKQIELAGIRPLVFYFVSNANGSRASAATGTTFAERRRSQAGNTGYPEYPNFVNNPDKELWPSAPAPRFVTSQRGFCEGGLGKVAFTTVSDETGTVAILIDLNSNGVQDGDDVLLEQAVVPGANTLVWNGLDRAGKLVAAGLPIKLSFTSQGAPVNFPVYDVEGNSSGLRVQNIRPSVGGNTYYDRLYWDDSRLTAAKPQFFPETRPAPDMASVRTDGVISSTAAYQGVHRWGDNSNEAGNDYTINTWTYGFISAPSESIYTYAYSCDFDQDGVDDLADIDDDNDGITDLTESFGIDPDVLVNGTPRYLAGSFVVQGVGGFRDVNGDGINDLFDLDLDGTPNHQDADSDGDGITDALEANNYAMPAQYQLGSGRIGGAVDALGMPLAAQLSVGSRQTVFANADNDNDGVRNMLDLDSDNDGILDNREAQTTATYRAPSGLDFDHDGLDNAYDSAPGVDPATGKAAVPGAEVSAATIANTDLDNVVDMLDSNSDNDALVDWQEGFDDNRNNSSIDDLLARGAKFAVANPIKAAYYASAGNVPAWLEDADGDEIPNFLDPGNAHYHDDNANGLVDLFDPAYGGTPSTAPRRDAAQADADFRFVPQPVKIAAPEKGPMPIAPLPVVLIDFQAHAAGRDALLSWATAQEQTNARFDIERSLDGQEFTVIGQRLGSGSTTQRQDYDFRDKNVGATPGTVYYRLRQVDTDDKVTLSEVKPVTFITQPAALLTLYPNPATDYTNIDLSGLPQVSYTIEIHGADGRMLARFEAAGGAPFRLATATYPVGTYMIRVANRNFHQLLKLVKN
ncbi:T9SS type A sorting domain-containing protein [Hymenobacter sp. BT188]|uniref:T9SS type A sorting domain-containing protein n=1 Tax=Hymenobacter sp. BT188 TaxID=2763504 RepID=UPI00165151E5|nr:T9SS type A sorting domain-containing protein [Hymenobacter sp. BT188]MBC6605859.1 T9SS type A sorting domain-containing protein [Hymenobacter sp. BT188]